MKIRFYANFRTIVDDATLEILDPSIRTLRDLFGWLVELYPGIALYLFDERGSFRSDVPLFVNGRNPRLQDTELNVSLRSDDEISIFSPISSGRMNVEVMRSSAINE